MCNKRYTSKTKNKEIRSVSGKTDSPMSLLFCSRFSGWILYWRMDAIPRNPSYSASFSPIIFLLHYPFLISLYLGLNMYISKDDDYVPTFESPWIHRGWTPAVGFSTEMEIALKWPWPVWEHGVHTMVGHSLKSWTTLNPHHNPTRKVILFLLPDEKTEIRGY